MIKIISKEDKYITKNKILGLFIIMYILYALITGVFIFIKPKRVSEEYIDKSSVSNYYNDKIGPDRAIIIDDPLESGIARLKIIDDTKETLDISYFSIEDGESSDLFLGGLIEAADRGVQVNLLLDGIFHGMNGRFRSVIYTFAAHPNMNLKFYEPLNIFMPWTINNRMHDKYIISDNTVAIIGGRNIGDKYFAPEWYDKAVTNDRDIIIVNTDSNNLNSVLYRMSDYFNSIFNHKYSKPSKKRLTSIKYNKGYKKGEELKAKTKLIKDSNKELFEKNIDIMAISSPTNKVSFIHNPIQRFSKEPWCWYEITQLMKNAKQSIFIQSPYVIPSTQMTKGFIDKDLIQGLDVSIMTNSLTSSPNLPGYSGYISHRKDIIDSGINVYEIQSKDSIHTKAFIIDDDLALIGSFNLDSRSTYLSTESMVVIHSSDVVEKVNEGLVDYMDQSLLVSSDDNYVLNKGIEKLEASFVKKFIINLLSYILRWFEYLL